MFCSKCGKEIQDNSKYCNACGTNLSEDGDSNSQIQKRNKHRDFRVSKTKYDRAALTGFIFGIVSVFAWSLFFIPQIGAIIASIIGLSNIKKNNKPGLWMAIAGLILGIVYMFVYMNYL